MRLRDAAETVRPGFAAEAPPFRLLRADNAVSTCRSWFIRFVRSVFNSFTIDANPFRFAMSSPSAEDNNWIETSADQRQRSTYTGDMLLATEQSIRQRVNLLRAEIAEISRLNEEYAHISHTMPARENHIERRNRLQQIVAELKSLSNFGTQRTQ